MGLRFRRLHYRALLLSGLLALSACGSGIFNWDTLSQLDEAGSRGIRDDSTEAVGFYSNGSLLGSVSLPSESPSHLKIFRPRDRAWGTKTLINTILMATTSFRRVFPTGDRVQVGDIAAEHGGTLSRHASHQNGLDADVAYLRMNHLERDPDVWGEDGFGEVFVKSGKLTKNLDLKRNWFLLKEVVASGNLSRIFVDSEIKRAYCNRSSKLDPSASEAVRIEVLRRLRPYPDHADHFHMRVKCPPTSPKCLPQEEPPLGSGCDRVDEIGLNEHDELVGTPL